MPVSRTGSDVRPVGVTNQILVTADGRSAFPVVDGVPVLLAPERMVHQTQASSIAAVDLSDPKYAEVYEEMAFYNQMRTTQLSEDTDEKINQILGALATQADLSASSESFPEPVAIWVDAPHDSISQFAAYRSLAPVRDKVFLQLGGSGSHAVKMLLANTKQAILLTPMLAEAKFAQRLAKNFGVIDRLACVLAVGEELPFRDDSIDLVYSGGCFHHMRLDHVAAELHQVLRPGGRFAGVDPWKTPLHTIGTKLLGKRESSVYCRPITAERVAPMRQYFPDLAIERNGPYLRYLFLGLEKAGVHLSVPTMMRLARFGNAIGTWTRTLDRCGESVVLAGRKATSDS